MDKLKRFIANVFPFSAKGWAFLSTSAGLVTLGLLRSELAVLFWGAAFGFSVALAAVGTGVTYGVVSRRLRGRSGPQSDGAALEPSRVREWGGARLHLEVPLPQRRVPGIRLYALARLEWNGRRISGTAFVPPGAEEVDVPLDTSRRGAYEVTHVGIVARDLLGFCERSVPLPCTGTLRVLPTAGDVMIGKLTGGAGGEIGVHSSLRRRTEELFETRRYVPGDDPRKINWNLFARWNELLVRVGEEVPPPRSRVLCYLYTGAPKVADEMRLEHAVSVFAGICGDLASRGVAVSYGFGGVEFRGALTETDDKEFLADLAEADWDSGSLPPSEDSEGGSPRMPVVLVTAAESDGADAARSRLKRGSRPVQMFEASFPYTGEGHGGPRAWWRRLLLAPPPPEHDAAAAGGSVGSRKAAAAGSGAAAGGGSRPAAAPLRARGARGQRAAREAREWRR